MSESYVEQRDALYQELWEVAKEKCDDEQRALHEFGAVPVIGWTYGYLNKDEIGAQDALRYSETMIDLEEFDSGADHGSRDTLAANLNAARELLNTDDGGVSDYSHAITDKLSTWKNDTGELFRQNYVNTIDTRKTNQCQALFNARQAVEFTTGIVDVYREGLLQLIRDAKKAMEDYNAQTVVTVNQAKLALKFFGVAAPNFGTAVLITAVDSIINETTKDFADLSAAGIMRELRNGVEELAAKRKEAYEELAAKLIAQRGAESWTKHVCLRPDGPEARDNPNAYDPAYSGGGI